MHARFVPGRTLVMAAAAAGAGLALGAAHEAMGWILASAAIAGAAIAIARLFRDLDVPTRRNGRLLLLGGLGATALAGFVLASLGLVAIPLVAAGLALAAAWEASAIPRASILTLSRDLPPRLALGAANEIALSLTHRGRVPLFVEVRDRAPWELRPTRQPGSFTLLPGTVARHRYDVTPPSRGAHRFESVDLRLTRFPGLVRRQETVALAGDTHVYPNLREVARYALLLHRKREHMLGIKQARRRGKGTEFESLREYQPDDEFRDISWKASARRGTLVTQTWQVERSQNVMILVEAGRMMSAQAAMQGVPPDAWLSKLDHSIHAALVLAQAAAMKEDRVGVLTFAEAPKTFLAPKRGRTQLTAIVDALHALQPALCEPDFAQAFQYLKTRAKRRSLVALFTDVLDAESARLLTDTLPILLPQHVPLVIAVSDPSVTEIANVLPASGAEAFDSAVAEDLLQERRDILRRLRSKGALVLDVAPGELSAAVVNKYLEIKARNLL